MTPNHYSAKLSDLDLRMALKVPPGGNWKDIPEEIPSARLAQIRTSYAAGNGSRSTYYGRLRPDAPAYTINTHFSRPGNGCHLHYDFEGGQHRVLSQREAARLQSFPDSFVFNGSRSSINQQIGNAVPPLLAYQIARQLPAAGQFVDLFSGAGGLSLGFTWAGWSPIVANDIEQSFLNTYCSNIHDNAICGDIRDPSIFDELLRAVRKAREQEGTRPLWVLGGPPCQGFSTAGNRRSMDDERNRLFYQYRDILDALRPSGFLFENVPGLLNMDGGHVFETVKRELQHAAPSLAVWKLHAESYGIPQRRTRLFLVGHSLELGLLGSPPPVTTLRSSGIPIDDLPPAVTVEEAISDLPPLQSGEDGSHMDYVSEPRSAFQRLMRGRVSPAEYVEELRAISAVR